MKPRFSILTLLGITAFAAIQIAAVAQPESYWPQVAFYLYAALLLFVAVLACGRTNPVSIFARAALTGHFLWGYLGGEEMYIDNAYPAVAVFNWWGYYIRETSSAAHVLADRCHSMALGMLLGYFALWRYRVMERREKPSS